MPATTVTITVELSTTEAWERAQLMKRIGWSEWGGLSVHDTEAEVMQTSCGKLQGALAEAGYAPR